MKRITELSEEDLLTHKNWKVIISGSEREYAEPDDEIEDLDYGWYLTFTEYTLNDGSTLNGVVTDLYQRSHHRVFVNGKLVSIGDWNPVEPDEYRPLCGLLRKTVAEIYPVKFECFLTHWGNKVYGVLDV